MNATATAASTSNYNSPLLATASNSSAASSQVSQQVATVVAAATQSVSTSSAGGTSSSNTITLTSEPMSSALPVIKPEIFLNDHSLVAVYCFVKNFIGASGTSAVAIDNKIEQAMDLVKSHLMFAVREEVEVLKERISELMDRINQLEYENNILKANASQETLSQLTTSGGNNTTSAAAAAAAAAPSQTTTPASAAAPTSAAKVSAPTNPNSNGSVS